MKDATSRVEPAISVRLAGGVEDQGGRAAGPRLPSANLLVPALDDVVEKRIDMSVNRDFEVRGVNGLGECETGDFETPQRLSVELAGCEFGRHVNPRDGVSSAMPHRVPTRRDSGWPGRGRPLGAAGRAGRERPIRGAAMVTLLQLRRIPKRTFGAEGKKSATVRGRRSGHPPSRRDGLADRGAFSIRMQRSTSRRALRAWR